MSTRAALATAQVAVFAIGCAGDPPALERPSPSLVEVVARGLTFSAPDTIPSGWVTIRFHNESPLTHFAILERLPDGVGLEQQQREVARPFQAGMDRLAAGDLEAAQASFGELPAWFAEVVFLGGPGLTAPGRTSEVTLRLDPGTYLLECYVKTAGTFHSFNRDTTAYGMVHELTVTGTTSPLREPEPTLEVTVSSEHGIQMTGDPAAGRHTVAIRFADQATYANFVGHDLHLARLEDSTQLDAVSAWMDWTQATGLTTPSPVAFLGGVNEMPAGSVGYLSVDLAPGRYAWIAEVPDAEAKGLLHVFSVP